MDKDLQYVLWRNVLHGKSIPKHQSTREYYVILVNGRV